MYLAGETYPVNPVIPSIFFCIALNALHCQESWVRP